MTRTLKGLVAAMVLAALTLTACDKDDENLCDCGGIDPAEELTWLKEAIDEVRQDEYSYYLKAKYKGEKVFYYGSCNPAANYVSVVKNCCGDSLGLTNDLNDQLTDVYILWKPETSVCHFED